ncbi:MAG: GNAT family N-acetyltransferase [Rhodoferax sp.]|jgi:ribosomal protein S18 acetylase RimI-like enzyme|nr:GNAT family N-acetyltransferase [Rhodoferax sp.]
MSKIARTGPDSKRPKKKPGAPDSRAATGAEGAGIDIRPVRHGDLDAVIEIDAMVTGIEKRDYWKSLYQRYADAVATGQHFLVATADQHVIGFVIGEVRDWEFGSPPCGWVFAIDVRPDARLGGTATKLLQAICAGFQRAGVSKVRTMLSRDNTLILSFFRSQGMMIGPFIPLEMDLES